MSSVYNVPIIHHDLPVDVTIHHIANALDYLTATVDDIFKKIDDRIERNCERTAKLAERVNKANEKIEKLIGRNKATIVYSSAKYPASNVHKNPTATFQIDDKLKFKYDTSVPSKTLEYDERMLNERLHFFHVKTNDESARDSHKPIPEEGLGCIPNDINSITSMLLYNTTENPYKRYTSLDPLNTGGNKSGQAKNSTEAQTMEDAPVSISNRMGNLKAYADTYFYSPDLGDVPQIDVPLDLPDLPGIADDISFSLETGPTIAPSIATTPSLLELPELSNLSSGSPVMSPIKDVPPPPPVLLDLIDSGSVTSTSKIVGDKIMEENVTSVKHVEDVKSSIPPPPKLPPPVVVENIAPPPPMPPAVPPPPLPPPVIDLKPAAAAPVSMSVPDDRSSLMAAIRQAGGAGKARLRAAKPIEKETDKKSSALPVAGGGNLMADLHAKLSMRRKGISGNKPEQKDEGGVMDKISAMIPPPPKLEAKTESDDTDWE